LDSLGVKGSPRSRQVVGLLLIVAGLLVFYFVGAVIASSGLRGALFSAWAASGLICAGSFLVIQLDIRRYLRSLLLVFVVLLGWSMVLLVQLPSSFQIFMFAFTSFIFGLLWYSWKNKPVVSWKPSSVHARLLVVAGIVLFVLSLIPFLAFASISEEFGLLVALFSMIPPSLSLLVGLQLARRKRLKDAVLAWLILDVTMLYPVLVVLPTAFNIPIAYQIMAETLIVVVTVAAFVIGVHSYRKRYRRHASTQV
jgi:hypothetical protein